MKKSKHKESGTGEKGAQHPFSLKKWKKDDPMHLSDKVMEALSHLFMAYHQEFTLALDLL